MKRLALLLLAFAVMALALPPLWFVVFREPAPELLASGRRVLLPGGVGVNVLEQGAGPPVVLVHGLPGCAYDWRELLHALADRGFRAFAYDRPGYGYSDSRGSSPHTVQQNAAELVALLAALDLREVTVVGWSYGGATAMAAAEQDPDRMARLVLVGSAAPGIQDEEPPFLFRLFASRPVLAWLHAVPPLARGLRRAMSVEAFSGAPAPGWWLPTLEANFARPHTVQTWRREMQAFAGAAPVDPSRIGLPVLVVHGDDDRLVSAAVARGIHRQVPRSRLRLIEGGSHMLPVTHADWLAEEIAALVRSESDNARQHSLLNFTRLPALGDSARLRLSARGASHRLPAVRRPTLESVS